MKIISLMTACLLLVSCQKATSESLDTMPLEFSPCRESQHSFKYIDFVNEQSFNTMNFSVLIDIDSAGNKYSLNSLDIVTVQQVEDVKYQLLTANQIYQDVLHLKPPLAQQRYQQAKFINVSFIADKKPYGRAYDEVAGEKNHEEPGCFIRMAISNQVYADRSNTPAHELFHNYQNSVMMFKQRWLTEGLARWSESLLNEGTGDEAPLPQSREQLLSVFDSSYGASKFWIRLFKLIDEENEFQIPSHLNTITYTDGTPIIKDNKAYGVKFISILFDELSVESKHVSDEKSWGLYTWKEEDQKSSDLNPYVWRAVKRAVLKTVPYDKQSEELKACMNIQL